ncbi:hypothetical protein AVEN_28072-1 [Araneus ventricosus]|uniref:Uncharacterized protein n=1 Tax=Araneus ventricosus TaxID=182803 RepID=A0A4Y1ZRI2_ARAVE|nr:hypothetical protein AVEN_28072-1 [Araneus ventricosus]
MAIKRDNSSVKRFCPLSDSDWYSFGEACGESLSLQHSLLFFEKPAGVASPKLSRKRCCFPSPRVDKKMRTYWNPGSNDYQKIFRSKSNSKRCVPISTLSWLKDNPSGCTDCHQVRMRM